MTGDPERNWRSIRDALVRCLRLYRFGSEEAEQEYAAAREVPLPPGFADSVVRAAIEGGRPRRAGSSPGGIDVPGVEAVEDEMLALNRNEGAPDDEVERRLEEHRKRLLGDSDGQEPGRDDPPEPPGERE